MAQVWDLDSVQMLGSSPAFHSQYHPHLPFPALKRLLPALSLPPPTSHTPIQAELSQHNLTGVWGLRQHGKAYTMSCASFSSSTGVADMLYGMFVTPLGWQKGLELAQVDSLGCAVCFYSQLPVVTYLPLFLCQWS